MESIRDFQYWNLFWKLTQVEFKLRDQGSVLGFLWTLLQPVLMFLILYTLFIKWLGHSVGLYAAYLLIGLVVWNFFHKATNLGLLSFRRKSGLLKNYRFPREIIVFSSVAAVFLSSLLEMSILAIFLPFLGARIAWSWIAFPFLVVLLLMLTTGVSLFLSVLAAEYADMERIWDVLANALFYLTPIFYPLSVVTGWQQRLLLVNPLASLLVEARRCLIDGSFPDAAHAAMLTLLACGCLAGGVFFLRRNESAIVESAFI